MLESTDLSPIRTAVIGVGYLGRFHAQKYRDLWQSRLIAVADTDPETANRAAAEFGVEGVTDYRELVDRVDAVSVVVPTPSHYEVAAAFLRKGVDVLVEKPIATSTDQAQALIRLARRNGCVLQVGHLERFNPAVLAAARVLKTPRFVESHRLAAFKQRGTDVSVVLDVMIHDIDLLQELVGRPIEHIDAVGSPVFSGDIDIVNARLRFEGGCVANTTASRISLKQERKIRVFQDDAYLSIDLQQKTLTVIRKKQGKSIESGQVDIDEQSFEQGDALRSEIEAFLSAVRRRSIPVVTGEDGLRALETAMRIADLVNRRAVETLPSNDLRRRIS